MKEIELADIEWPCYPSRISDKDKAKLYSHIKCKYLTSESIGKKVYSCEMGQFNKISPDELKYKMEIWNKCPAVGRTHKEGTELTISRKQLYWIKIAAVIGLIALLYMIMKGCSII